MIKILSQLLKILIFSTISLSAVSESLTFSYWNQAGPPFAFTNEDEITGGLIKDIGDEIAKRLGYEAKYERFPVLRVEQNLIDGFVDMTCVTSPIWQQQPDKYAWSPELFTGKDRFLIRAGEDISQIEDLNGKVVGVYHDFIYHPDIMNMFDTGKAEKLVVRDVATGLRLVNLKRIDTFIEFGSILSYELKKTELQGLALASKAADEFSLHCSYSPKMPVAASAADAVIKKMVAEGVVSRILNKYK